MTETPKLLRIVLRVLGIIVFGLFSYSFVTQELAQEQPRDFVTLALYFAAFIVPFQFLKYGLLGTANNTYFRSRNVDDGSGT